MYKSDRAIPQSDDGARRRCKPRINIKTESKDEGSLVVSISDPWESAESTDHDCKIGNNTHY